MPRVTLSPLPLKTRDIKVGNGPCSGSCGGGSVISGTGTDQTEAASGPAKECMDTEGGMRSLPAAA